MVEHLTVDVTRSWGTQHTLEAFIFILQKVYRLPEPTWVEEYQSYACVLIVHVVDIVFLVNYCFSKQWTK